MYVRRDWRTSLVTVTMGLDEFREHVEWLEEVDPGDRATRDFRKELDRIDPPKEDD